MLRAWALKLCARTLTLCILCQSLQLDFLINATWVLSLWACILYAHACDTKRVRKKNLKIEFRKFRILSFQIPKFQNCWYTHATTKSRFDILMGYPLCRQPLTIAHCCKLADSWHFCIDILDSWCPNLTFGMRGASILTSWETLGRFWNIGDHKKWWQLVVQAWFLSIFCGFRDFILRAFWLPSTEKDVSYHICFQIFFWQFW